MSDALLGQSLQNAKDLLGKRKTLPILPKSAQKIIALATNEFVDLKVLANCIEEDLVISARIVGLANSPFYGQTGKITSVESAVIHALGLDLTRGIAIGMACSEVLDSTLAVDFDRERFWRNAIMQSILSSFIAENSTNLTAHIPLCSLAGLLDNIGLLAAVALAPDQTQASFNTNSGSLRSQMITNLGCHHRHITAALAELWTLPPQIQAVFSAQCRDDLLPDDCIPLHACLRLADLFEQHVPATIKYLKDAQPLAKKLALLVDLETIAVKKKKSMPSVTNIVHVLTSS